MLPLRGWLRRRHGRCQRLARIDACGTARDTAAACQNPSGRSDRICLADVFSGKGWRPRRLTSAPASIDTVAAFRPWRSFRPSVARGRRGHHRDETAPAARSFPLNAFAGGEAILRGKRNANLARTGGMIPIQRPDSPTAYKTRSVPCLANRNCSGSGMLAASLKEDGVLAESGHGRAMLAPGGHPMSRTFSMKSGWFDSLKLFERCGCPPNSVSSLPSKFSSSLFQVASYQAPAIRVACERRSIRWFT
ncbi:hypothetical protein XTPLMG728_2571 [Xanthomonas translucens pv. poae]|uniref:Uncharacterized protein n=1 Tax=Xanthomonas graminis pv. poae TaxID=227946 RepID=A0A0K2ZXP7_9XANT|nr:hypothetical protein XTPLMG728_2571 [Xanthomonas translucens pv. poae]